MEKFIIIITLSDVQMVHTQIKFLSQNPVPQHLIHST